MWVNLIKKSLTKFQNGPLEHLQVKPTLMKRSIENFNLGLSSSLDITQILHLLTLRMVSKEECFICCH